MITALRKFGRSNEQAEISLFYFAGHGMQIKEVNYLLPLGININNENDVQFEGVDVGTIRDVMRSKNKEKLNIIILDACRDNPYRSWDRGGHFGLAKSTPLSGDLIAFSTSPNSVAANGQGRNGLYTGELIKQLRIPQRIEDIFINTRIEVERKSYGNQSPWELSRLRGTYYLKIGS